VTYQRLDPPRYHRTASTAWAEQVGGNLESLWTERPHISLWSTSPRTVPNNSVTQGAFPTVRESVGDWSESLGSYFSHWYAPRDGFYLVTVHIDWEPHTEGTRKIIIETHSQTVTGNEKPDSTTGYCCMSHTALLSMIAGEIITVYLWQNSGTALDVPAATSTQPYKQSVSTLWIGAHDYL
jgi:hypothetical protein